MSAIQNKTIRTGNSKKKSISLRRLGKGPVLWLIPLALVLILMFLYPTFEVIRLSFTNAKITSSDYTYTLDSFKSMFRGGAFYTMLRVTAVFVVLSVVFQTLVGFVIALAVDKGEKLNLKGTVFVRTVALMSWAIPGVVIGIIWRLIYDESSSGVLNYMLESVGIGHIAFLSNPAVALISVTVANIWRGSAQSMILLYAGLKTVQQEMVEAAEVDGASAWQRLTKIIIPSIMPVVMINITLNTIYTVNTFDMVMSLTGGGPGRSTEVLALNSYTQIFQMFNLGRGAAVAVFLLGVNVVMASIYFHMIRNTEEGI